MAKNTTILIIVAVVVIVAAAAAVVLMQGNNDKDVEVTYDGNGGTTSSGDTEIKSTSKTTLGSDTFTRSGYELSSWNTKSDGTGTSFGFGVSTNGTTKLYAIWEKVHVLSYSLIYTAGGAETPSGMKITHDGTTEDFYYAPYRSFSINNENVVVNIPITLDSETHYVDGEHATAVLYYTTVDGMKCCFAFMISGADEINIVKNSNSVDVKFKISNDDVEVITSVGGTEKCCIFFGNGGVSSLDMTVYMFNKSKMILVNEFKKEGYKFKEWNTEKDGSGDSYEEGYDPTSEEREKLSVLYAQWTKI